MTDSRITRKRPARTVSICMDVSADVVDGTVTEEELHEWVRMALAYYHEFRGGWVLTGPYGDSSAGIRKPTTTLVEDYE